jgi:hypothetical protein
MEAFSMLIPGDWSFEGDIKWSTDNILMPAACEFKVSGNGITMQALPGQAFSWTSLMQVRLGHPVGSSYIGGIFCPLLKAKDIIIDLIIPSLRHEAADITITDEGTAGALEGALGFEAGFMSTGTALSEGARIRIEYDEDGKKYEEELFCTVTSFSYKIPAGGSEFNFVIWMADNMFSFRAEKGVLDQNAGILQSMAYSLRLNPRWFEMYNRIVLFLKDKQARGAVSLQQLCIDADRASAVDDAMGYVMRHSAYSWIAGNLGRARATLEYYDPIQQVCVRLPAAYGHAWANDSGQYMLSDRCDIPPDSSFTEIWKMMEPMGLDAHDIGPPAIEIS